MNLVSRGDIVRLDSRHLLDSLAAIPYVRGRTLLDIGTGPGLPGIPLAIAQPDACVTLWERMARRVRFLQMACRELDLQNIAIQECDFEKATRSLESPAFDTVVARAVAPVETLWPMMRDHVSADGCLIVYSHVAKPEDAQQNSTLDQDGVAKKSPLVGMEEVAYAVPGLAQKHYLQLMPRTARTGHRPHETLSHE